MTAALRVSVAANVALLAVVGTLLLWRRPPTDVTPAAGWRYSQSGGRPREHAQRPAAKGALTPDAVAALERVGVAPETIAAVVIEDFERHSNERLGEWERHYAPKLLPQRELTTFFRRKEIEREAALRAALGEDGYRAWDRQQTLEELNYARLPGDPLPMSADEAEKAVRLQKDFDEKTKALQMAMEDGVADPADGRTLLAQARQALDAGLEQLLGEDRFADLRGHLDSTGHLDALAETYQNLGDLAPSAAQARAAMAAEARFRTAESELAQKLAANQADADAAATALGRIAAERDQAYRDVFGAEAYDRFKLAHDEAYQTLTRYAAAWNLDASEVQQVYRSLNAFEADASQMRTAARLRQQAGQHVDWDAVDATIERAKQQALSAVGATVGTETLRRMQANGLF